MSIIETIKAELPAKAMITDISFEGSEIILYTKNKEFFTNFFPIVKKIVNQIKKRIDVRADPSILVSEEKTQQFIKKVLPKEAGMKDIYFEPEFAKVVIHAEKPGLVIGKNGSMLSEIRDNTFWSPSIKRAPVIDSEVIKNIRKMLHSEADYRKKFLNETGKKIYGEGKEVEWIRATFLGGFREVGRSCILLQTPQTKVLLDCGISVKKESKPFPYLESPEFHVQDLDAVIISHAHLDHSGLVPFLYEMGYKGPTYCTRPTRDLSAMLQLDYLGICKRENEKSPYSSKGIEEFIKHCIPLEWDEVSDIAPDMRITLENSGHLLGASTVHIHIGDGMYNILYTGDLKYGKTMLFDPAFTRFTRVEALMIESTYGTDIKPSFDEAVDSLVENIKKTIERGGRVIIPSFAVGRAQEVVAILAKTDIDVPIYLDGMTWDATAIHTAYPEFMSKNIQTEILHKGENPFVDPRLKGIGSQKEREAVLLNPNPAVVIATSGMLTAGPALEYLKEFSPDPKNSLIFVGYQGEGTLGRRIQKGWKQVQLEDRTSIELNLEIMTVDGLGGHSDQKELLNFISRMPSKMRKIVVNHGESTKCVEFAKTIHKQFMTETVAPRILETIRFK
ncbi:MAG: beta-CASP ribonuclease aCPSF1 [Candidatus Aenigmarchaeota archaeon]|nr:beta-CASP ribonuclease aCPSF1 [Candidatus Aenigmarchaeota archaeon]